MSLYVMCAMKDHPRVCGEKYQNAEGARQSQGSPPRMRGKVYYYGYNKLYNRITPAYAGKSVACFFADVGQWDHPRVCGEKTKKIP